MDIGYPGYPWLLVNGSATVQDFFLVVQIDSKPP